MERFTTTRPDADHAFGLTDESLTERRASIRPRGILMDRIDRTWAALRETEAAMEALADELAGPPDPQLGG
jgi:hypothetical protein